MKFVIRCASGKTPPCDGAIESDEIFDTYALHSNTRYGDPELTEDFINNLDMDANLPGHKGTKREWLNKGRKHRFEDEKWRWDIHRYVIEIENLLALMALESSVDNPLVVSGVPKIDETKNRYNIRKSEIAMNKYDLPLIKIYDDYIE